MALCLRLFILIFSWYRSNVFSFSPRAPSALSSYYGSWGSSASGFSLFGGRYYTHENTAIILLCSGSNICLVWCCLCFKKCTALRSKTFHIFRLFNLTFKSACCSRMHRTSFLRLFCLAVLFFARYLSINFEHHTKKL